MNSNPLMRWTACVVLALFVLVSITSAVHTVTLQSSVGTTTPSSKVANAWIRGRVMCTVENPCVDNDLWIADMIYQHYTVNPSFTISGTITAFSSSTGAELTKELPITFSQPLEDKHLYKLIAPFALYVSATPVTEPIDFIVDLHRTRTQSDPHVDVYSITTGAMTEAVAVDIVTTKDLFYHIQGWSNPDASVILGSENPIPGKATPYDNMVHLDFNLSWNWWNNFGSFDKIWIKPVGFGYLHNDIGSYECLFAGNILTDIEIIIENEEAGTYYLELSNLMRFTDSFLFDTAARLQLQCTFPNKNPGETTPHRYANKWISYSLIIGQKDTNISNAFDNFAVWFTTLAGTAQSPLNIVTAGATFAIGNTPAYSLQSRFINLYKKKLERKYMSYYYVSFPLELPEDYETKTALIMNSKNIRNYFELQVNALEAATTFSLEYAQFYITCTHQTIHPTLLRTYIIAYGDFNYDTRIMEGPIYPANDTIHNIVIKEPQVRYNPNFHWQPDGLDPNDQLPQCIAYTIDIGVGLYNEYNLKLDFNKLDKMYSEGVKNHPMSMRLLHTIDPTKKVSLRHDFISSFSDSSNDNAVPVPYADFEPRHVKIKKENKTEYIQFDMELSTKGVKKTSDLPYDQTMGFILHIVSGLYQFKLDSIETAPNISCNIKYGSINANLPAIIISDRRITFEVVEEDLYKQGLPYDTDNIHISCPGLFIKKIDNSPSTANDKFYLNIALQIPDKQTYILSVFGRETKHQKPRGMGGGMIFLLTLLVLGVIIVALVAYNYFTNGSVVRWFYATIPWLNPAQRGAYESHDEKNSINDLSIDDSGYGSTNY